MPVRTKVKEWERQCTAQKNVQEEKNKVMVAIDIFNLLSQMEELLPFIFSITFEVFPLLSEKDHSHHSSPLCPVLEAAWGHWERHQSPGSNFC